MSRKRTSASTIPHIPRWKTESVVWSGLLFLGVTSQVLHNLVTGIW